MLTVITPTGGRPQAFALCERWMARQTFEGDIQWIVVDDGAQPTPVTMGQTVVRPEPFWPHAGSGTTQHRNLAAGLGLAQHDRIAVIEDDDYYGPHYLENCLQALESHELVGETPSRYYNVKFQSYRLFENDQHSSLCQTAFRASLILTVLELCSNPASWIDIDLWKSAASRAGLYAGDQVVGIKGMPGRGGVSRAHRIGGAGWHGDVGLPKLRQWIGADIEAYLPFIDPRRAA